MLRFILDKLRESPGPFKQARLIAGDLAEEVLDIAEHYLKRRHHGIFVHEDEPSMADCDTRAPVSARKTANYDSGKRSAKPAPARELDVPEDLASALDAPANSRKQEFKVLAILYDAKQRAMGDLSAKQISDHGKSIGVLIRHENVRKIIRMRLENHVKTRSGGEGGAPSIYHYHITPSGEEHFRDNYLNR